MAETVTGIDTSTKKLAVAQLMRDGSVRYIEMVGQGRTAADRFSRLMLEFAALGPGWYGPGVTVFLEEVGFVRGGRTSIDMAQVVGGVRTVLAMAGSDCMLFHPMTVKAKFGLARSPKSAVVEFIRKALRFDPPSDDVADAALVALYGRQFLT